MKQVIIIYNGLDAVAEIWIKTARQIVDKEDRHLLDRFVHSAIDKQSGKSRMQLCNEPLRVHKHHPLKQGWDL